MADANPFEDLIPQRTANPFADLIPAKASITDAVTDIPNEMGKAYSSAAQHLTGNSVNDLPGYDPRTRGELGPIEGLMRTGKQVLGIPELLASLPTGLARSVIGHLMSQGEHAVGTVIAPEIAAKDNPQAMYETAKGDVDLALSAGKPAGNPVKVAGALEWKPPAAAAAVEAGAEGDRASVGSTGLRRVYVESPPNEIVDAARRVSEVAPEPINVPRAFASDNIAVQRTAQGIRNLPVIGDAIPRATGEMTDQLGNAVKSIASSYGDGSGPNVASRIGRNIGSQAEAEAQASSGAAANSDAAVLADWERSHNATRNAIGAAETSAADTARQAVGDMSPQDMGATLIARLRQGEREAHATKERLYGVAANSDGAIDANAVRGIRGDVTRSLDEQGLVVDPLLTPAASRMVTELDNISSLRIPNRVASPRSIGPAGEDVNVAAVNMQGLEQTRKRLNALSQAAANPADRRAARHVIGAFDDWLGSAFDNALFSGSDEALQSYRAARAANADWRTRFGFNERDDADRVLNRIVTGEVTPQEVSNYIVGASKVGAKGVSSRLMTRLAEATGNDPEALQAIRGGVWNRLSQTTEGTTAKPSAKVADDINEFLQGSGRDVANRLFTPEQQGVMRAYANTLRRGAQQRELLDEVAKNTKPSPMKPEAGPMKELADAVLGKGGKSDEALFTAIDSYAKAGGRSDIQTLADIVRNIPVKDRGDLAGSIIRNLGQSKQTGGFSLDLYASEWSKYTPQAKAILFGNSGPYRTALDDIAKISQRYKDIGKRFGNPSGTAQNANLLGTAVWAATSPYTAIPTLLGAGVAAKMLSAPAGAASLAKWGKAFEALQLSPNAQRMVAFQIASRNLANTASGFGANVDPTNIMRLIQSPGKAAADEKQNQVPGRIAK